MKILKLLPILTLLTLGQAIPSYSAQTNFGTFHSPLRFTGTHWKVESAIGPVYLARQENGSWRVLTVFDGTNGKYFLNWENPAKGTYVAIDSLGACSEPLRIGAERDRSPGSHSSPHSCNLAGCPWGH
jgi:hypothetical protein